ncbi:MAG: aminotransferase class I/II-fold pyridoxal phosphate-dependent enzyme [Pseudomonadales bacterium]
MSNIDLDYQRYLGANLSLDLTRGKPCPDQLDLSHGLEDMIQGDYRSRDGVDTRNYGGLAGIPEARELGARLLDLDPEQVMAGGNSSLSLMYQYLSFRQRQWAPSEAAPKFICLVPGYDRHFSVCEHLGIAMINVALTAQGPDLSMIESLVQKDPLIHGIWCVPKHSNPTGHIYSPETVQRLARLPLLTQSDFTVMWDNAYAAHDLHDDVPALDNLMAHAVSAGTEDQIAIFGSTSKITLAGAGLGFCGLSPTILAAFQGYLEPQTIGFDKVNQLRHARLLKDDNTLKALMDAHRKILRPKFDLVDEKLKPLGDQSLASWSLPLGGYFVSLDLTAASARQVVHLAGEAGVKLTPAGATFPYGNDPEDKNIRIAPSFPDMMDLSQALDVLVCCIQKASHDAASTPH